MGEDYVLRGQARRLSLPGVRRRRGDLPAVAQRPELGRYFPELALPGTLPPGRYVLDGEIVVRDDAGREDFDALGQRIHPAASRIERLSGETPAVLVVFDLLAREDEILMEQAFTERRAALEQLVGGEEFAEAPVELMPTVGDSRGGAALARRRRGRDREAARGALPAGGAQGHVQGQARAHDRRGDRRLAAGQGRGHGRRADPRPLRRGRHRRAGRAAPARRRALLGPDGEGEEAPGRVLRRYESGERGSADPSRWSAGKDLEWVGLRPELVVEIDFDHVSAGRIRHGSKLRCWRDDKDPRACTFDQLHS